MTPAEWQAIGDAMQKLHAKDSFGPQGPSGPSSQDPFPQDHDSYEWFVQIHGNRQEAKACKHGNELIWPWHRAFLLHFENKLRAANLPSSANITLPYWDWTEAPTGQEGYPKVYEDQASPLWHKRQHHGLDIPLAAAFGGIPQGMTPGAYVEQMLQTSNWAEFGGTAEGPGQVAGSLESELHNNMHGYIGEDNRNTIHAVRDPIFWAHHANLDRLWDQWQAMHSDEPQCSGCEAPVYDRDTGMGALKFSDVLHDDKLPGGVQVVYLAKGQQPPLAPPVANNEMPMGMMGEAAHPAAPQAPAIVAPVNGQTVYSFTMPPTTGYRVRLKLGGVAVPTEDTYRISVYVYPASLQFAAARAQGGKYKARVLSVFANGHGGHDDRNFSLDLTNAFRAVPATEQGHKWKLALYFENCDQSGDYSDISQQVSVRKVELSVRDFATATPVELKP